MSFSIELGFLHFDLNHSIKCSLIFDIIIFISYLLQVDWESEREFGCGELFYLPCFHAWKLCLAGRKKLQDFFFYLIWRTANRKWGGVKME